MSIYFDQAHLKTIGYGHKLTGQEMADHTFDAGITKDEATDLMRRDLVRFEESVSASVKVPLSQHQFDALICFSYNVGTGAFESSSLLRLLNEGKYAEVPGQLVRWCHLPDGRTDDGLYKRRLFEAQIWATPDDTEPVLTGITDEDRAHVAGLVALNLAELARGEDDSAPDA